MSKIGPGFDKVSAVSVGEGLGSHFFDIGAGGKGLGGAGEDDGGDGRVFVEGGGAGVEFVD